MKNKNFTLLTFAFFLFISITLQSCGEEKYTVWTDTETYSEWYSASSVTIEDGHYIRTEIDKNSWAIMSKSLINEEKHRWDEATIKKWLFGNGFGEYESTKESSWLVLVEHGMIISRSGNLVYIIIK